MQRPFHLLLWPCPLVSSSQARVFWRGVQPHYETMTYLSHVEGVCCGLWKCALWNNSCLPWPLTNHQLLIFSFSNPNIFHKHCNYILLSFAKNCSSIVQVCTCIIYLPLSTIFLASDPLKISTKWLIVKLLDHLPPVHSCLTAWRMALTSRVTSTFWYDSCLMNQM